MDEIVRKSMLKWPNVPHCYGWLGLDARGHWRMRDDAAQQQQRPGDRIVHEALLGFINRNYLSDAQGRWYFQNGPQRVYVNLEATPYIARTDPARGVVLHTGTVLTTLDAAWLTETGQLILQAGPQIAQVDDRDLADCLALLQQDSLPVDDAALLAWLEQPDAAPPLHLAYHGQQIVVRHLDSQRLAEHFGFVPHPQADPLVS